MWLSLLVSADAALCWWVAQRSALWRFQALELRLSFLSASSITSSASPHLPSVALGRLYINL